ncbi:MAG: 3-keto-disaccharide hydrolase [Flavobacteriaceae bacterium]
MKYVVIFFGLFIITSHTVPKSISAQDEWEILFDGTSFNAWKGYLTEKVPDTWKLENGAMVFYPPSRENQGAQNNIVTKKEYNSFVLSLEWKISKAGNSGIFWGVKEDKKYRQPYETGPEIQVLDNKDHPDAKRGNSHQAGALYDMVSPTKDLTKAIGKWNLCVITVNYKSNEAKVELNGVEIVTFKPDGEAWDTMVANSKFANWEGFGKFHTGKIGLQDHGDRVAYRNIKIKEL